MSCLHGMSGSNSGGSVVREKFLTPAERLQLKDLECGFVTIVSSIIILEHGGYNLCSSALTACCMHHCNAGQRGDNCLYYTTLFEMCVYMYVTVIMTYTAD